MNHRLLWGWGLLVCAATNLPAQVVTPQSLHNWPQWRGPLSNGVSPEGSPPLEWGDDRNIRWKIAIPGKGHSTPIIWGDRLFLLTAVPTDRKGPDIPGGPAAGTAGLSLDAPVNFYQFVVLCYDRRSGEKLWEHVANEAVPHEGGHPTNSFASASPATDGERLYVSFGSFGIYCYDLQGTLLWKRDLGKMTTRVHFGEGSSPTIYEKTLIVNWDQESGSFIAALDAATGETLWKVDRDEPTTWATPLVVEFDGRKQVIVNGRNRVRSYDLGSGEVLWECGGQASNPIPSPVVLDDLVYCMTGYQGFAVFAIPLRSVGDLTDSDRIAWKRTDAGPYVSSPLLYDGQLYFTKSRDAILYTVDPRTGEDLIKQKRLPGLGTLYASPVAADGKVYLTDRDGTTLVLQAGTEFKVLATNRISEVIDASAAIVGDQLFLRGNQHLYCIEQ